MKVNWDPVKMLDVSFFKSVHKYSWGGGKGDVSRSDSSGCLNCKEILSQVACCLLIAKTVSQLFM